MLSILIPFVVSTMCLAGGNSSPQSETTPPVEQEVKACKHHKVVASTYTLEDSNDESGTDEPVAELPPVQEPVIIEKD